MNRSNFLRFFFLMLPIISLTSCIDLAVNDGRHKHGVLNNQSVDGAVYTMRGGLGGIFSTGMNELEDILYNKYKIHSLSTVWFRANGLSASITKQYRAHILKEPIILVGHSLGANDQIKVARDLYRQHIPVALLITVDPVSPLSIPPNVKRALNIYQPGLLPLFTGVKVRAMDPSQTVVENYNLNEMKNLHVNHFNITGDLLLQKIMISRILDTFATSRRNKP